MFIPNNIAFESLSGESKRLNARTRHMVESKSIGLVERAECLDGNERNSGRACGKGKRSSEKVSSLCVTIPIPGNLEEL
jgi:hypothetical protein